MLKLDTQIPQNAKPLKKKTLTKMFLIENLTCMCQWLVRVTMHDEHVNDQQELQSTMNTLTTNKNYNA